MSDGATHEETPHGFAVLLLTFDLVTKPADTRQTVSFRLLRCLTCFALVSPDDAAAHQEAAHA